MTIWERLERKADTEEKKLIIQQIIPCVIIPLNNFLNSYQEKTPTKILGQINEYRGILRDDFVLTPNLKEEMENHLDSFEIETRKDALLSCGVRYEDLQIDMTPFDSATEEDKKRGAILLFDRNKEQDFQKAWLEHLRTMSNSNPKFQEIIKKPIGKELTRKAHKLEPSYKNWPMVKYAICTLYQLLWLLYPAKPRIATEKKIEVVREKDGNLRITPAPYKRKVSEGESAIYPQGLLEDIVEIFQTEFPGLFNDLTIKDVKSRIQYRLTESSN